MGLQLSMRSEVPHRLTTTKQSPTQTYVSSFLIMNGVQYSTGLTANDCFELGRQSYHNRDSESLSFVGKAEFITSTYTLYNVKRGSTFTINFAWNLCENRNNCSFSYI